MPTRDKLFYYWDSCVFISYLNNHPDRVPSIKAVWDEAQAHKNVEIVTSTMSIAEVVFSEEEKVTKTLNSNVEIQIKEFWYSWGVLTVEMHPAVLEEARRLMRKAAVAGMGLKPADAIQLATAVWVHDNLGIVREIHTYDNEWLGKFGPLVESMKICHPSVPLPILD